MKHSDNKKNCVSEKLSSVENLKCHDKNTLFNNEKNYQNKKKDKNKKAKKKKFDNLNDETKWKIALWMEWFFNRYMIKLPIDKIAC